ncbi:MAG TPA: DUF2169 domain-containing protein [Polyangia bacterium]|nr:DUF2169 domain-containing protein [Polyangia bacterium]
MKTAAAAGTAMQISARDAEGRWILSVLAKRTYSFRTGRCTVCEDQQRLVDEPIYDGATGTLLEVDTDLWPFKPMTDIVVSGHAYNHPQRPEFVAGVRVDRTRKLVRVYGDRRASLGFNGQILFSRPTTLEKLPLSYAHAYGGRDAVTEASYGNPVQALRPYLPPETTDEQISAASPFVYPKNPAGRGYVVEKNQAAIEAARLPNLEDPRDLLTPDRFVSGDTGRWPLQPVPANLGWLDYGAFPRMAWMGVIPDHDESVNPRDVGEVRLGYVSSDVLQDKKHTDPISLEGTNGASLGLRVPHLSGGEEVELLNVTRALDELRFRLPSERPELWIDGRNGKLAATQPVIHSVVIEPDENRLTVTWRGCAPALRAYASHEMAKMPFAALW